MTSPWRHLLAAPRFMPLAGVLIGAVGGIVYWTSSQLWPTSVAVVLSMMATALLSGQARAADWGTLGLGLVFAVLLKYNALMALSAASLSFALPANVALGVIMIAGNAASRALAVSAAASPIQSASTPITNADVAIALVIGFTPAALIGIPGLIGLVVAIVARVAVAAHVRHNGPSLAAAGPDVTQQLTEICFYLGALATWAYI